MPVSKAQQKATNKYMALHYDRINLTVEKGMKETIKVHAAGMGESVNGFINRAIVRLCFAFIQRNLLRQLNFLFVIIMSAALLDYYDTFLYFVHKAVFIINSATPVHAVFQRFRFSCPFKRSSLNFLYQSIDPLHCFLVLCLPI